jgi:hypothetical protein
MTFVFCLYIQSQIYIKLSLGTGTINICDGGVAGHEKNIESDPHKIPAHFDALAPDPPAALFIPHAPNKEFALSRIYIFALTQE